MWRSKKFIVITVLVAVVLVGGIGGVAFAQPEKGGQCPHGAHPEGRPHHGPPGALFESFGFDQEAVQAAFEQARSELEDGTLEGERRAVMNRVLEILGIDEQEWQDACDEMCPERPERPEHPEGMPPSHPGFGFRGPGGGPGGGPPGTQ